MQQKNVFHTFDNDSYHSTVLTMFIVLWEWDDNDKMKSDMRKKTLGSSTYLVK